MSGHYQYHPAADLLHTPPPSLSQRHHPQQAQAQQQPVPAPYDPQGQQYAPYPGGYPGGGYPGGGLPAQQAYSMHGPYAAPAEARQDPGLNIPGINGPGLNPLNFMAAGSNFFSGSQSWGQQYVQRVQQRMGWLSWGANSYLFAVNGAYVRRKLVMLLAPYLKRWTYIRQPEQVQGAQQFKPPREDLSSPDLYIPLMAAWAYAVLLCGNALRLRTYTPDAMYSMVWSTCSAWLAHTVLAYVLLRAMSLPNMTPWAELGAYVGYSFVPACVTLGAGMLGGSWAWRVAWLYGALCSSVFLVRTIKSVIYAEARNYGLNLTLTNYLLMALALFQFPFLFWMTNVPLGATPGLKAEGLGHLRHPA